MQQVGCRRLAAGLLVCAALGFAIAPPAEAGEWGFSFGIHGPHPHFGFHHFAPRVHSFYPHPPGFHFDRVYHPDYYHWTPDLGFHSHGHYHVVPHYAPHIHDHHYHW